ncbi:MAG TPA: ISLre2 family transposase [Candidatus Acetatifactor stercoripullorum]|uniref:ISLre2 family transposase n=1 Tax=Candidatus Acetatifactor stercoripullorum TaxID=2838414 RepID=A0A9D1UCK3_9FIRM|nr:ISLre2 family transposase [uncultured Acetatifactor sp.]HIW81646.1 ISLre2 family transposase [Candidatus Acetatifactor stercoripullorum]
MSSIIKENGVTFKELEKNIYAWVCQIGREFTKEFLERYDRMLMEGRDKKKYRNKGARQTTVKTVYGEVTYQRIVYEVTEEDGTRRFVYLLDETLDLDHVGLISTNLSELLVKGITELSYRECALQVSEMTGQTISAMGVWNVIQALGEKVCEEEAELTEEYKRGNVKGKKDVPVLFEEADGVYIKLQGKNRKKEKQDKAEIKIGIAYDGWRKTGPDRYALENKVVVAGFAKAKEFQEYREAVIAKEFNLDEVSQRILNADGASWIKKVKDKSTCFQLDPFHRNKAVKEKIHEEAARDAILELLKEDIEELFQYLETYRNSLSDEDEIEDVEDLIHYYENNQEGLVPYQSQGLELPDPPEGLEYRNMGTMENHVWSVIAKRMKHGHRSWNHLAKILAKKCSGKLHEVTERLRKPVFEEEKVEELYGEILMSAKAPKKDGKGYQYPAIGHVVGLDGKIQGERKRLLYMAGY